MNTTKDRRWMHVQSSCESQGTAGAHGDRPISGHNWGGSKATVWQESRDYYSKDRPWSISSNGPARMHVATQTSGQAAAADRGHPRTNRERVLDKPRSMYIWTE